VATREARALEALIDHYLREWDSRGWAGAYHGLIEMGPRILPVLEDRLAGSREAPFRAALVELARQLRTEDALPLLTRGLRDRAPEVWKAALDGLVALASPAAIAVLEDAARRAPPGRTRADDWSDWIGEALEQARAARVERPGTA
jgi:HEAT repeat protein